MVIESQRQEYLSRFDAQLELLQQRRCPSGLLSTLIPKKEHVVGRALGMQIPATNIPFVPVLSRAVLPVRDQLTMLRYKGNFTANSLYSNNLEDALFDIESVPTGVYYVFDVGMEEHTIPGRLGLTLEELFAVCLHSEDLDILFMSQWNVLRAWGSRYLVISGNSSVPTCANDSLRQDLVPNSFIPGSKPIVSNHCCVPTVELLIPDSELRLSFEVVMYNPNPSFPFPSKRAIGP